MFGADDHFRGSGSPGPGNSHSAGRVFNSDPRSLPVLVRVVMVLGLPGQLVSIAMVLALPVLATLAVEVLEMASLISLN